MSEVDEKADAPMIVRAMDIGKFVRVNDSFKVKVGFDAAERFDAPALTSAQYYLSPTAALFSVPAPACQQNTTRL